LLINEGCDRSLEGFDRAVRLAKSMTLTLAPMTMGLSMKDQTKWIEAAKVLMENPFHQVPCPKCGLGFLTVEDEKLDNAHFDRHLRCATCGAHETIYKRKVG